MGLLKWVRNKLENTRGKPNPKYNHVEGTRDNAERAKAEAWAGIVVITIVEESPSVLLLDELDKRSPKR